AVPSGTTAPAPVVVRTEPRLLHPFPIVRIRGVLTRSGARVTRLTVRGPRDVRISVRGRGGSCPRPRPAVAAAVTLPRPGEGVRAAGVSRGRRAGGGGRGGPRLDEGGGRGGGAGRGPPTPAGRGAAPRRRDRCVYPNGRRPVRCPEA